MAKYDFAAFGAAGVDLSYLRAQAAGVARGEFIKAAVVANGQVPADKVDGVVNNVSFQFWKDLTAGTEPIDLGRYLTPADVAAAEARLRAGEIVRQTGGNGGAKSGGASAPAAPTSGPVTDTILTAVQEAFTSAREDTPTTAAGLYQRLWKVLPEEVQVSRSDMVLGGALTGLNKDQMGQVVAKLAPEVRTAVMAAVGEVAPDKINANVQSAVTSVYHLNLVAGQLNGWDNNVALVLGAMSQDKDIMWVATDDDKAAATKQHVLATLRLLFQKLTAEVAAAKDAPAPLAKIAWPEVRELFPVEARPGMQGLWDSLDAAKQHDLAATARAEAEARAAEQAAMDAQKDATAPDAPADAPEAPAPARAPRAKA